MWLRRMLRLGSVCLLTVLGLAVQPVGAVEYRLQVTHLDHRNFFAHLEHSTRFWRGEETMGRLEALLAVLPATKEQAWTTLAWEGNPGDTVAFVVKTEMLAWQEVRAVAANPEGALRRLSIGGPALFGRQWQQVPAVADDWIAYAVDRGTFTRWVEGNAKAVNGMSVVVGRGRSAFYHPDRVYLVIKLPPEPRTFKLVIGWQDRDDIRNNGNGNGRARR